ncbi:hypothetical protein JR050_16170 [Bacillus sp. RD4P76]|uniref:Uncharacterized protein n=2 Tax=Bacillus suaedaesalsae TaxID=2810349 RepID=A0ABS2DL41_9BACI|nr:hypothetical protein [Bacillus suaedaesalsae]MBM6619199.1 hypothetical protein [Bacillus suaedaesalsae]
MDEPWWLIDSKMSATLDEELKKEISPDHILFGLKAEAVARREDNDDVVYWISEIQKYAVVHLTYSKEASNEFPLTNLFTLSELKKHCKNVSKFY